MRLQQGDFDPRPRQQQRQDRATGPTTHDTAGRPPDVADIVRRRMLLFWLLGLHASLSFGPEPSQKYFHRRFEMLVVGQPVLHQSREEQLPRELWHEHPYEGPGAGTNVVGAQSAELDLAFQIVFEEIEHPPRATLDEHLGNLRATDGLTYRKLQHSSIHPFKSKVSPTERRQSLLRR